MVYTDGPYYWACAIDLILCCALTIEELYVGSIFEKFLGEPGAPPHLWSDQL